MAATVKIGRWTGSTAAFTDITSANTRANAEDAHSTAGTSNPIKKPTSGSNYSYWVSTRLRAGTAPTGTIDNIRWFSDGTNNFGTGITCLGNAASSYIQATGTPGETGTQLTTGNHSGLTSAPQDVFSYTSGSPKSLTGSTTSTGDFGEYFVYQIAVSTAAGPGATSSETFSFRYDET